MVWYACKSSRVVLAWHSARQASAPGALKARWDTASYSSDCQLCKTAQKGSRPSFSSLEKSAKSINGSFAAGRRNSLLKLLPGRLGEPAHQLLMYQIRLQGR